MTGVVLLRECSVRLAPQLLDPRVRLRQPPAEFECTLWVGAREGDAVRGDGDDERDGARGGGGF